MHARSCPFSLKQTQLWARRASPDASNGSPRPPLVKCLPRGMVSVPLAFTASVTLIPVCAELPWTLITL